MSLENFSNEEAWNKLACPWTNFNPSSPKEIHSILDGLEAAPRKRWGQNFLIDLGAQQQIISLAKLDGSQHVWEIGPGLGALTQHLWRNCASLRLFEIDPAFCNFYRYRIWGMREADERQSDPKAACQLIEGDFLKTWKPQLALGPEPQVLLGNLPYNSASIFMTSLAMQHFPAQKMIFTVQKEMADRLCAEPSTKAYSSFSVFMQLQYDIRSHFSLGPQLFHPQPHIVSQVISLEPKKQRLTLQEIRLADQLCRCLFAQRRKTIANNIKNSKFQKDTELFAELDISLGRRAESIPIPLFTQLVRSLSAKHAAEQAKAE